MFGFGKKKEPERSFPPVPSWRPTIEQPINTIVERLHYYLNGKQDFIVFKHGTCAIVNKGIPDKEAVDSAKDILYKIFHFHPDMNPLRMDDGNILIQYNQPAVNIVLTEVANKNMKEIDQRHLDALADKEVLITPAGPNKFDDFGKQTLFGRCFMFMDAQKLEVDRIERAKQ